MGFDPKCYELAEYFLPSTAPERLKVAMAQAIQDAVESYIEDEGARLIAEIERKPS